MAIREQTGASKATAEILADEYAWLLTWALSFTQNDRALAEDLVQETVLRIIHSYPLLSAIINIKALLYVTLKNVFLTDLRRSRRRLFEDLSAVDFDSLQLSLRECRASDAIEVQDQLRKIAAFLCWRKQASKSASILVLRFFHELLPGEIMALGLLSRKAVERGLHRGRTDLKLYLADPAASRRMLNGEPPVPMPRLMAVPALRFVEELESAIALAKGLPCLAPGQLLAHYRQLSDRSISCDLLAHLVSCRTCRVAVLVSNGQAPNQPGDAPSTDEKKELYTTARTSVVKLHSFSTLSRKEPSMKDLERRLRQIYEHRPRSLIVMANAQVLATRPVDASSCSFKVEARGLPPLEEIEVMSDQGVCLLTMFVPALPPFASPSLHRRVSLSDGRSVEIALRFTGESPIVEVVYSDPSFAAAEDELRLAEAELGETDPGLTNQRTAKSEAVSDIPFPDGASLPSPDSNQMQARTARSRWKGWVQRHLAEAGFMRVPLLAGGLLLLFTLGALFSTSSHKRALPSTGELLLRTEQAEFTGDRSEGVIFQKLRIRTSSDTLVRSLYRDVQRRRVPRMPPSNERTLQLRRRLEAAGVDWNDPLGGASYKRWHDREHDQEHPLGDNVVQSAGDLLTLTTDTIDGEVSRQTLTVRPGDFHPVRRTIAFRDSDEVEIVELSYEQLPWSAASERLFESVSPHPQPRVSVPSRLTGRILSDGQLDEADLEARLALNRAAADTGEQITIARTSGAIVVSGIVETLARKQEIRTLLEAIPHVRAEVRSAQEPEERSVQGPGLPAADASGTGRALAAPAAALTAEAAEPLPLEKALVARGWSEDDIGRTFRQIFSSSVAVARVHRSIAELEERASGPTPLTEAGRAALNLLLLRQRSRILSELQQEQQALDRLWSASDQKPSAEVTSPFPSAPDSLSVPEPTPPRHDPDHLAATDLATRNLSLCNQLLSVTDATLQREESLIADLRQAVERLRAEAILPAQLVLSDSQPRKPVSAAPFTSGETTRR